MTISQEFTEEFWRGVIADAVRSDSRFAMVQTGIAIQNEVENSAAVKVILARSYEDAAAALKALALVDPEDSKAIRGYQNVVHRALAIREWLIETVARGEEIADRLAEEDREPPTGEIA